MVSLVASSRDFVVVLSFAVPHAQVAVDSDTVTATSRAHAAEQLAFVAFGRDPAAAAAGAASGPAMAAFTALASSAGWTTVTLPAGVTFVNPVVTCSPVYGACEACDR